MELKLSPEDAATALSLLLIVPYGIETRNWLPATLPVTTFNCTLWN